MVPAPYSPLGISPWKSRYSSGWSSVRTALRLRFGSSGMPLGTAHEASAPSRSSLRSQCRRVAWCSCTTKRPRPAAAPSAPCSPPPGAGSGVVWKSRLARYGSSLSAIWALIVEDVVGLAVEVAVRRGLLGDVLLAHAHLRLGPVRALLGVLDEFLLGHLPAVLLPAAGL